jgi:hypothetical protein
MSLERGATFFSWSVFPGVMFGSIALSIAVFAAALGADQGL